MNGTYVHGYEERERARLEDQARTLAEFLHGDTTFPSGSRVLEVGCGTGAQTVTLARRSAGARFVAIDISAESLKEARRRTEAARLTNVEFRVADLFALPYRSESFDHVFVCFVLEHVPRPALALSIVRDLIQPGGTITLIEGDHGSAYFHPESAAARAAIGCLIELQRASGGNPLMGRELYSLLVQSGFGGICVSPRMVYVDASRPDLVEGFSRKTFIAMIEGVREPAIAAGLIAPEIFDAGIQDLDRTTGPDGVFCYTFFKALATKART